MRKQRDRPPEPQRDSGSFEEVGFQWEGGGYETECTRCSVVGPGDLDALPPFEAALINDRDGKAGPADGAGKPPAGRLSCAFGFEPTVCGSILRYQNEGEGQQGAESAHKMSKSLTCPI